MSVQSQLRLLLDNQRAKLEAVRPVKKEQKITAAPKKTIEKKQKTRTEPIKKQVYKVLVPEPQGLNAAECASIRALVHIVDPNVTGIVSDEKWTSLLNYWKELISKYNTQALRASIPEQGTQAEDSDEEAERNGINLEETDNEDEGDDDEEEDAELKAFIAPEDESGEEEGDEGEEDEFVEEGETEQDQETKKNKMNQEQEEEVEKKTKKPRINMEEEEETQTKPED